MSNAESIPRMADDAERLFLKVAQKEGGQHQNTRDLTPQLLEYLGFPSVEAVRHATEQIRLYAHQNNWDPGVCLMCTEDDRLVCGPGIPEAWHDYERRRMA